MPIRQYQRTHGEHGPHGETLQHGKNLQHGTRSLQSTRPFPSLSIPSLQISAEGVEGGIGVGLGPFPFFFANASSTLTAIINNARKIVRNFFNQYHLLIGIQL